ncbi:MAG: PIN domain-containing protein [Acidobacteria bacterium]|nr:PIN domain-containing protein [Acidobacteriota bacterium]MCG3191564.1 tRNA(fMet)-specific endonuclease VapC [Thermoanaerobaculia bacterium]
MVFLDTNILLYAVSKAPAESAKSQVALRLLDREDVGLSVQVLQEFFVQATRPTKEWRLTHRQAILLIESWLRFRVQPVTTSVLMAAIEASERFRVSYWDAAIIEGARALGCKELLSEDLNDGQDYGGVTVRNPFRDSLA